MPCAESTWNLIDYGILRRVFPTLQPSSMASGGPEDDECGMFVTFEENLENLGKFLSTHKPSDPLWNKYVFCNILDSMIN